MRPEPGELPTRRAAQAARPAGHQGHSATEVCHVPHLFLPERPTGWSHPEDTFPRRAGLVPPPSSLQADTVTG